MSLLGSLSAFSEKKPVTAGIAVYDPNSGGESGASRFDFLNPRGKKDKVNFTAFQYFPERVSDSKAANYSQKEVPGGSHPLYTFINGGARVITFDAIFTSDKRPPESAGSGLVAALTGALSSIGPDVDRKDTVDIAAAIAWLRKFLYPKYESNIAKNPDLLVVYLPNSGIIGTGDVPGSVIGIMTRCDVAYEGFHRDGTPRIAVVSLEFHEVVQTRENWRFFGANYVKAVDRDYKEVKYTRVMVEGD